MHFTHFSEEDSELKFKGIVASIYHSKVGGHTFEHVVMPDSAKVIAVTKEKQLILLKEKSFSDGKTYYSVPGGRVGPHESPEVAAKRELQEETGLRPDRLELWFVQNYSQTIISRKYFFIAKGCIEAGPSKRDATESIQVMKLNLDAFLGHASGEDFKHMELQNRLMKIMIDDEARSDFKTIIGL